MGTSGTFYRDVGKYMNEKPEKQFFDEKTGILHGTECPKTKKEFGEDISGSCELEEKITAWREAGAPGLVKEFHDPSCAKGPAQVATKAYRDGHDRIFGTRPTLGKA
jgi:hypothetical protein